MKRLKLQKALLAICLALPITLTTSNGINAMQPTDLQTEQKSNNNEPNETTQTADTFSQYYDEYAEAEGPPLAKADEAYSDFLRPYIRNDITKSLALMLQANYEQIKISKHLKGKANKKIPPIIIYDRLLSNLLLEGERKIKTQNRIITYNFKNEQLTNNKTALKNLFKISESEQTNEQKILSVLFKGTDNREGPDNSISQLEDLIKAYKLDKISIVDKPTSTLISFLEPVAQQLTKELSYLQSKNKKVPPLLEKLVSLVKQFSELYNNKQQETKKLINILATKKTHKEAIQEFVNFTNITHLGEKEYKQFLLCYIGNNLVTYLALLLQARYDLLQFPKEITIDQSLNFKKIHEMLFDEYPEQLIKLKLSDKNGPITQAVSTILTLSLYYVYNAYYATNQSEYLKNAAYIILILFIPPGKENYNTKITQLKKAIENYILHEQPEPGAPRNTILSLFGEIAKQLQKEAAEAFDNSTKAEQLEEIAKLLSNFIDEYNKKLNQQEQNQNAPNNSTPNFIAQLLCNLPDVENTDNNINTNQDVTESHIDEIEEGEEIEENKLNNSTPNIKVKGIFDENDDVNEPNTLNQTINVKLKENWDDVLAKNWYGNEAEDRDDNISNYSQGEPEANIDAEGNCEEINYDNLDAKSQSEESLHLSKDNEGTGKDLNADTNTEHNPQTNNANNEHKKNSITTEGKQDPNTIKVEEDPTAANEQANAPQEAKTNSKIPGNNAGHDTENTENNLNNTKKAGDEPNQLKEEKERAEKIEQLKEEVNAYFNKNKETDSNLTTTQKIINNLSATNKMLQIINLILY